MSISLTSGAAPKRFKCPTHGIITDIMHFETSDLSKPVDEMLTRIGPFCSKCVGDWALSRFPVVREVK